MPFATINGNMLHFQVKGEGIPIVFIHPPLLTKANFNYQVAQLSGVYKVITFDIRGHGQSSASHQPITYALITEDIIHLMDHLNIPKAYLCGYSTGGSIVLDALLSHPKRFYGGVLISSMSEASDLYMRSRISLSVSLCRIKAKRALLYAICRGNADNAALFRKMSNDSKRGNIRNWRQYFEYSLHYNCTYRLGEIQKPILLVYGKKDRSFYRYADILASKLPNNKLILIRGATHQVPTKAALSMNEIIRYWLTEVHNELQSRKTEHNEMEIPLLTKKEAISAYENRL